MNQKEFDQLMRYYPKLRPLFEPVERNGKIHWRRIRKDRDRTKRTKALLESQCEFGTVAFNAYGSKGYDENGMPIVAAKCQKAMIGKRFARPRPRWLRIAEELQEELRGREVIEVKG